jgi:hypothetical protein
MVRRVNSINHAAVGPPRLISTTRGRNTTLYIFTLVSTFDRGSLSFHKTQNCHFRQK